MSDDFSDIVKRVLASRVGNRCSNPECRALTSGPQDDPGKAINLGVAAHVTAASPGGPRYDPALVSEERSSPLNGVWLCQNCAKLIDNDASRFSVDLLKKWKSVAEAEAKDVLGKTATQSNEGLPDLLPGSRVRIVPIVPRKHEQSEFMLEKVADECLSVKKLDSGRQVLIPKSFVEKIHRFGDSKPALMQLNGRLQWISAKRNFECVPGLPPTGQAGLYGIGKNVDSRYPMRLGISGAFARIDRLPEVLSRGWHVYYDEDGMYLILPDLGANQVFVCSWV
jgi:hypothetical protein